MRVDVLPVRWAVEPPPDDRGEWKEINFCLCVGFVVTLQRHLVAVLRNVCVDLQSPVAYECLGLEKRFCLAVVPSI